MNAQKRFFVLGLLTWLALFALSLNFKPPDYRPWNRLRVGPFNFKPDLKVQMKICGDLGRIKGISELQYWREQTFTIDRWGFRNLGETEKPRVVVAGDSYAAGGGLNDDETITSQMGKILGEPVYNYSGEAPFAMSEFLADERFKNNPPKIVVFAPVYRAVKPFPLNPPWNNTGWKAEMGDIFSDVQGFKVRLERDNYLAAVFKKIIARFSPQMVSDLSSYIEEIDVQGQPKLVISLEIQGLTLSPQERQLQMTVSSIVAFNQQLKERGVHFIFAPIPESGTIYPEFFKPGSRAKLQDPAFMDLLFQELGKRGIDYIDLRPDFSANRFPYLYLPDDAHWNPRAVGIAAKTMSDYIKPKLATK
jgi:alginate O-acetyltransferase complex protein AlgJ